MSGAEAGFDAAAQIVNDNLSQLTQNAQQSYSAATSVVSTLQGLDIPFEEVTPAAPPSLEFPELELDDAPEKPDFEEPPLTPQEPHHDLRTKPTDELYKTTVSTAMPRPVVSTTEDPLNNRGANKMFMEPVTVPRFTSNDQPQNYDVEKLKISDPYQYSDLPADLVIQPLDEQAMLDYADYEKLLDVAIPASPEFNDAPPAAAQLTAATPSSRFATTLDSVKAAFAAAPTMFDAALAAIFSREDLLARKASEERTGVYDVRGAKLPSESTQDIQRTVQVENAYALSTIMLSNLIKSNDWRMDNLRFILTQNVALEGLSLDQFTTLAKTSFDLAKAQLALDMRTFQMLLAQYNARARAYGAAVSNREFALEVEQSKIDFVKTQTQTEGVKAQANERRMAATESRIIADNTRIDLQSTQLENVKTQLEVAKNLLEQFKGQISVQTSKLRLDAKRQETLSAALDAEGTKIEALNLQVSMHETSLKTFDTRRQVAERQLDVAGDIAKDGILVNKAKTDFVFKDTRGKLDKMQEELKKFQSQIDDYKLKTEVKKSVADLNVRVQKAKFSVADAVYKAQLEEMTNALSRFLKRTAVVIDALEAAGTTAAQLSAGCMAALNIGATIAGSAQGQGQASSNFGVSHTYKYQEGSDG